MNNGNLQPILEKFIDRLFQCKTRQDIYVAYAKFIERYNTFIHKFETLDEYRNCLVLSLIDIIEGLNNLYYNEGESPLSDECYDEFIEIIYTDYDEIRSYFLNKVGSDITTPANEVTLPYYMGSMNKIKDWKTISGWCKKYNSSNIPSGSNTFVMSAKLDGISALFVNGQLFTRGNGTRGRNITYILPHIGYDKTYNIPHVLRGELIMTKQIFQTKYSEEYASARNLVCGVINRNYNSSCVSIYEDIRFVVYDIYDNNLTPSHKLDLVHKIHEEFHSFIYCVDFHKLYGGLTMDILNQYLMQLKTQYAYEVDGVVVTHNRCYNLIEGENPRYSFAYKNNDVCVSMSEAVVERVVWNVSKDGYLKPKLKFVNPVTCDNSKITFVTGFNAKYIQEHGIERGSRVLVGLSGNVIPHIFQVLTPKREGYNLQEILPSLEELGSGLAWSKNNVDLVLLSKTDNVASIIKRNLLFFSHMEIKCGIQETTLKNVYNQCGIYKLSDILSMTLSNWTELEGIGDKKAIKIMDAIKKKLDWNSIQEEEDKTQTNNDFYKKYMIKLCVGSQCFGRGFATKKIDIHLSCLVSLFKKVISKKNSNRRDLFLHMYEKEIGMTILNWMRQDNSYTEWGEYIKSFGGVTHDSIILFMEGWIKFIDFMKELSGNTSMQKIGITFVSLQELWQKLLSNTMYSDVANIDIPKINKNNNYYVFSGFRNKSLEDIIIKNGGSVEERITSKTNYIIVRDKTKITQKVKIAMDKGIQIISEVEAQALNP